MISGPNAFSNVFLLISLNSDFLKCFSLLNDSKVIVFKVFNNESFEIPSNEFDYDMSALNDSNFLLHPSLLYNVTVNEVNDDTAHPTQKWSEVSDGKIDIGRKNHLTPYNHQILSNIIVNFFYQRNENEEFKEKFYTRYIESEFIYD